MIGRTVQIGLLAAGIASATLQPAFGQDADPAATTETMDAAALVKRLGNAQALDIPGENERLGRFARNQADAHPDEPQWRIAWVIAEAYEGRAKGVIDEAERLAELLPDDPGANYALGLCLASTVNDVAIWNRGARASRALDLWTKAIEVDPAHVGARFSMIQYYRFAPGIAGGSMKRAQALAEEGLAQPIGSHVWHIELAEIAAEDKDWDECNAQFASATDNAPNDRARRTIATSQALTLLQKKDDPAAALAIVQPVADAVPESLPNFLCARALRELDRCEEAVAYYERVLERQPEAQNSRIEIGLCLADLGHGAEARVHLERFLEEFPKHDRAKEARKALKSLD